VQWGLYFLVPCDCRVIVRSNGVTRCKSGEQILCNHLFFLMMILCLSLWFWIQRRLYPLNEPYLWPTMNENSCLCTTLIPPNTWKFYFHHHLYCNMCEPMFHIYEPCRFNRYIMIICYIPETWCRMWWYYCRPSRYILCPVTS
jgi:hypothetical protein